MRKQGRRKTRLLRVLLADDHELVRRGIRGLLASKHRWRVVAEAGDGVSAVGMAAKLKPEIVILDVDMPGLNGLEAAPRIRKVAPNAKIIILTLHESAEMVRRALEVGAHGFVLKSDLADRLVTALLEVSRGKPFLTDKVSDIVMRDILATAEASDSKKTPTARETEVIRLLADGRANKEVAAALGISVRTAEAHRANIMKKLGLTSLAQLVHYALHHGVAGGPLQDRNASEGLQ